MTNQNKISITNAVEDILKYHPDLLVSIKEILDDLKNKYSFHDISYDELLYLINNDNRFEYINVPEHIFEDEDNFSELVKQEKSKVEKLGFYSGSRVKLRSVEIDSEKIVQILNRKVDLMMQVLTSLWEKRPLDDANLEDHLLEILAKAQKMQREIKSAINSKKIDLTDIAKKVQE